MRPASLTITVLALLALLRGPALGAEPSWRIGPAPDWVETVPIDLDAAVGGSGGHETLIVDWQNRVGGAAGEELHIRVVDRATAQAGLSALGTLQLDVDPTYQKLTLHRVRVFRDGHWQDRLAPEHIREAVRERRLEYRMYDGRKTVAVTLPDLRIGDVVETAYTFAGAHPSAEGRALGRFGMAFTRPVGRLRLRLVYPDDRAIAFQSSPELPAALPAAVVRNDTPTRGWSTRTWERVDVAPLPDADDQPDWYDARPTVELSEWPTWGDIARWGARRYLPSPLPPDVAQAVAAIRAAGTSQQEQTVAALRWVQAEIRYVGVEIGVGAFDPSTPETVAARRFGDCKDKARLLVGMLVELGVKAYPLLVSQRRRHAIRDRLPSPFVFDHVVVAVELGSERYVIDPTRSYQAGPLGQIAVTDFGYGLPVTLDATALVALKQRSEGAPRREVTHTWTLAADDDEPAELRVETVHRGEAADDTRSAVEDSGVGELGETYRRYYERSYRDIAMIGPPEVTDDQATNTVTVREHYRVTGYAAPPTRALRTLEFWAPELDQLLQEPVTQRPDVPLQIAGPAALKHKIVIELPRAVPVKAHHEEVSFGPGLTLHYAQGASADGRRVTVQRTFERTVGHLDPIDVEAYRGAIRRARDLSGFELRLAPEPGGASKAVYDASVRESQVDALEATAASDRTTALPALAALGLGVLAGLLGWGVVLLLAPPHQTPGPLPPLAFVTVVLVLLRPGAMLVGLDLDPHLFERGAWLGLNPNAEDALSELLLLSTDVALLGVELALAFVIVARRWLNLRALLGWAVVTMGVAGLVLLSEAGGQGLSQRTGGALRLALSATAFLAFGTALIVTRARRRQRAVVGRQLPVPYSTDADP